MRAVVFPSPGKISEEVVNDPICGADEVIVQVSQIGICGTDVHIFRDEYHSKFPVIAGLLYYNFIRFNDWLYFGYVTISSAEWLMEAVRTYGMFNVHFVPENFYAMFVKLPRIQLSDGCFYFSPTREGISILATTPAIIYIFRRFKLNWWTVGAWTSIILSIGLLLFYHNTGSWQLGYRYLLDFILPVLLLIGLGIGKRPSRVFTA